MQQNNNILFVYGALRSGTTVFRLMLDAHPQIANPGEMDFLFDYLHRDSASSTGWRYDLTALKDDRIFNAYTLDIPQDLDGLDLLNNLLNQIQTRYEGQVLSINLHRHVDKAYATLRDARFLHMLRDPRDVARSSIVMGWAGTMYHGVGHWIGTETAWDAANIEDDKTLTLRYEDLMEAPETHLAAVCGFIDLPFMPDMLRYYENTTYGPPDASLTYQWKKKANRDDVAHLESRAGELMRKRGYIPVGDRNGNAVAPSAFAKIRLALSNKSAIWRSGVNQYGPLLFLGEKTSRRFKMVRLNRHLQRNMQNITTAHLK